MDDKEQIMQLYETMYKAMIAKDMEVLDEVHDEHFILIHMTGMRQSKQEYLKAIKNGTLNYYSAKHEQMEVDVTGDRATLTGRSLVNAAVFGGGRHTWRLQLRFQLIRRQGIWYFTESQASTY